MTQPTTFGRYFRQKRVESHLSLRSVADRLGVSHVYLSEIERGVRPALARDRWEALTKIIPGVTMEELEKHATLARPIQLELNNAPLAYQDLGLALARRIQQQDLPQADIQKLLRVLRGSDDAE